MDPLDLILILYTQRQPIVCIQREVEPNIHIGLVKSCKFLNHNFLPKGVRVNLFVGIWLSETIYIGNKGDKLWRVTRLDKLWKFGGFSIMSRPHWP